MKLLLEEKNKPRKFIKAHLEPKAQVEFGKNIAITVKQDYAMMDTSDGLMDALSIIANESGVLLDIDFDKIPHDKDLEQFENWQNLVLLAVKITKLLPRLPRIVLSVLLLAK